jgi:hypothetical protein
MMRQIAGVSSKHATAYRGPSAKRNHALPVDDSPLFDPQVEIEDAIVKAKR